MSDTPDSIKERQEILAIKKQGGTLVCPVCHHTKPLQEFMGPGPNATINNMCARCTLLSNGAVQKRFFEKQLLQILHARDASTLKPMHELIRQLVDEFGGETELVRAWKLQIDQAIIDRPGTKTILDVFKQIANLYRDARRDEYEELKVNELPTEDLRAMVDDYVARKMIPEDSESA